MEDASPSQDDASRPGPALQLAALGPQDLALTQGPGAKRRFFDPRASVRRPTPFALEARELSFPLGFRFGATNAVSLPGDGGDLLGDLFLEVRLPAVGEGAVWVPRVGYMLLRRARLLLDDLVLHSHERLWYDISDRLFAPQPHRRALDAMLGGSSPLDASAPLLLHVPLKMLCCKTHHRAGSQQAWLPLLCLARSASLRLEVEAETLAACLADPGSADPSALAALAAQDLDVRVLADYVSLDAPERASMMAEAQHVLPLEEPQDVDALSYLPAEGGGDDTGRTAVDSVAVDLRELGLPVKMLAWVAYDEVDPAPFQYSEAPDSAALYEGSVLLAPGAPLPRAYYTVVQPYFYFPRSGDPGVCCYSFALWPDRAQPSGGMDFSARRNPTLRIDLTQRHEGLKLKVWALTLNWLVVRGGSASVLVPPSLRAY